MDRYDKPALVILHAGTFTAHGREFSYEYRDRAPFPGSFRLCGTAPLQQPIMGNPKNRTAPPPVEITVDAGVETNNTAADPRTTWQWTPDATFTLPDGKNVWQDARNTSGQRVSRHADITTATLTRWIRELRDTWAAYAEANKLPQRAHYRRLLGCRYSLEIKRETAAAHTVALQWAEKQLDDHIAKNLADVNFPAAYETPWWRAERNYYELAGQHREEIAEYAEEFAQRIPLIVLPLDELAAQIRGRTLTVEQAQPLIDLLRECTIPTGQSPSC